MAQAIMLTLFLPRSADSLCALRPCRRSRSVHWTHPRRWITDNFSWRWIFYINIPVGILAFFLVTA